MLDSIPAFLSAIASVGAALAAMISLRISKQAQYISELNALASHHASATTAYVEIVKELNDASVYLKNFSYAIWSEWGIEIECFDNRYMGGNDPRPLRHVLSNGSEMLSNYAIDNPRWGSSTSKAIMSIIRLGVGGFSETEYEKLLSKVDGCYCDFEGVFNIPKHNEKIGDTPAFRWVCYQLNKRLTNAEWKSVWDRSWEKGAWLDKYWAEYSQVKSVFEQAKDRLAIEKAKLSPSAFPLSSNPVLYYKYENLLKVVNHVIEDADVEKIALYKNWKFHEEIYLLVLCVMAIGYCLHKNLDSLYIMADD